MVHLTAYEVCGYQFWKWIWVHLYNSPTEGVYISYYTYNFNFYRTSAYAFYIGHNVFLYGNDAYMDFDYCCHTYKLMLHIWNMITVAYNLLMLVYDTFIFYLPRPCYCHP